MAVPLQPRRTHICQPENVTNYCVWLGGTQKWKDGEILLYNYETKDSNIKNTLVISGKEMGNKRWCAFYGGKRMIWEQKINISSPLEDT